MQRCLRPEIEPATWRAILFHVVFSLEICIFNNRYQFEFITRFPEIHLCVSEVPKMSMKLSCFFLGF